MLVLTRCRNESVVIDTPLGPVTVTLVEVRGDKARLGITAPREIPVHRQEVWQRVKNSSAVSVS